MSIRTNDADAVREVVNDAVVKANRHFNDGKGAKIMFTGNAPKQRPQVVWIPLHKSDKHPERLIAGQIKKYEKVSPLQVHPA